MSLPPQAEFWTPDEVSELLRVDRKTVYAAIHDGRLPAVRAGRMYRVAAADLRALAVKPAAPPTIPPPPPRKPRRPSGEFTRLARATLDDATTTKGKHR